MVNIDDLLRELCITFFTHKKYFMVEGVPYLVVDLYMPQYVRYKEALQEHLQPIEDKKLLNSNSIVSCYVVSNITTNFAQKALCANDRKDVNLFDDSFNRVLLKYLYQSLSSHCVKGNYYIYKDPFNRDLMKRFGIHFCYDAEEPAHLKVFSEVFSNLEKRLKSLCDEKV